MAFNPDFLNKNWYRKYPLRATASYVSEGGTQLPQSLFAGARISSIKTAVDLYISKVFIRNSYINVTVTNNATGATHGYFEGTITDNNQLLKMVPVQKYADGYLVIGDKTALAGLNGSHTLSYTAGKIEDSLIFAFPAPGLTAIKHEDKEARGFVVFEFDNVQQEDFEFGVVDRSTVLTRSDRSSSNLSCPTNVITGINTVVPNSSGNIDIYAIAPLIFVFDKGKMRLTTQDLALEDICNNQVNIPPLYEIDEYKGYRAETDPQRNILITETPEWKDIWPQYTGFAASSPTQTGKASIKKAADKTVTGKAMIV